MSQKLALIIGNSDYDDSNLSMLAAPDADVNALAELLRDPEIGGFDEVVALVNQPSTTIRREISGFFTDRGREDLLLLYFSGHGIRDDRGQLFLAVKDTEHKLLRGTAIPAAYITEEMDNSRSRRQVLILDCCHSGAFSQGMKAATGASVGTGAVYKGTGSGRVVLTATDSTQYAWEGDRVIGQAENSVFTHYLIQGLHTGEADSDGDGRITLDELYDYVYDQVVNETPMQTPGKWSYGQQGEMVIARNPRPVVKPIDLPPDLQQTIDDPRPWVREGAVQELVRILHGGQAGLALAAHEALKRLANDDSRRVATAASESLAAYSEARPLKEEVKPQAQSGPDEREGQKRRSDEQSEAERSARKKPADENLARERTGREPLAQAKFQAGDLAAENREIKAAHPIDTISRSVIPEEMIRPLGLTILGWTVCWAFGWIFSEIFGWNGSSYDQTWAVVGIAGGFISGLALRRTRLSIHWKQILLIILGWTIGILLGGTISVLFTGSDNNAINGTTRGVVGGLITALAIRWAEPSVNWKQILWITIGWTAGCTFGQAIGPSLYSAFNSSVNGAVWFAIPGAIMGAISAAIGAVVMYWQLGLALRNPMDR